jgi:hypothetical protein
MIHRAKIVRKRLFLAMNRIQPGNLEQIGQKESKAHAKITPIFEIRAQPFSYLYVRVVSKRSFPLVPISYFQSAEKGSFQKNYFVTPEKP